MLQAVEPMRRGTARICAVSNVLHKIIARLGFECIKYVRIDTDNEASGAHYSLGNTKSRESHCSELITRAIWRAILPSFQRLRAVKEGLAQPLIHLVMHAAEPQAQGGVGGGVWRVGVNL